MVARLLTPLLLAGAVLQARQQATRTPRSAWSPSGPRMSCSTACAVSLLLFCLCAAHCRLPGRVRCNCSCVGACAPSPVPSPVPIVARGLTPVAHSAAAAATFCPCRRRPCHILYVGVSCNATNSLQLHLRNAKCALQSAEQELRQATARRGNHGGKYAERIAYANTILDKLIGAGDAHLDNVAKTIADVTAMIAAVNPEDMPQLPLRAQQTGAANGGGAAAAAAAASVIDGAGSSADAAAAAAAAMAAVDDIGEIWSEDYFPEG